MSNICLVCGFNNLYDPPYDKNGHGSEEICPCCGFQYNYDDSGYRYGYDPIVKILINIWRLNWIRSGYLWFSPEEKPKEWDPKKQLQVLRFSKDNSWRIS